jgi:hypothetical protein
VAVAVGGGHHQEGRPRVAAAPRGGGGDDHGAVLGGGDHGIADPAAARPSQEPAVAGDGDQDDVGVVLGRPPDASGEHARGPPAGSVEDPDGEEHGPRRRPGDPLTVVRRRRRDPGHVGAVAVVVVGLVVAVDEVSAREQPALQVGVLEVDPGVEDGDHHLLTDRGQPRVGGADEVEGVLLGPEGIVDVRLRGRGGGGQGHRHQGEA